MSANRAIGAILAGLALASVPAAAAERQASHRDWLRVQPEQMRWWQDARFGMFVCWGPVSLTGLEIGWSRGKAWPHQKQGGAGPTPVEVYDNLYKKWRPDKFNAREWVKNRQGRRLPLHDLPGQAPRRVLPFRHQADRLPEHQPGSGVAARRDEGCCRSLPRVRPEAVPLLLAARLASPRLPHARTTAATSNTCTARSASC